MRGVCGLVMTTVQNDTFQDLVYSTTVGLRHRLRRAEYEIVEAVDDSAWLATHGELFSNLLIWEW